MGFAFDRKYLAALVIALLSLGALAAAGWRSIGVLRDNVEQVRHARDLQFRIDDIRHTLLQLESSQRGYLLTHDEADLQPYRAGLSRLPAQLDSLTRLLVAHDGQQAPLARLRSLVEARAAALARKMELGNAQGAPAALALVRTGEGRRLMDEIGVVIEHMDREEARTLAQREAAAGRALELNLRIGATVIGASALMLLMIRALMRRELAARSRAEHQAEEQRSVLEREVQRRTGELLESTRALALSEARLRGIFESATDAILTVDESQHVVMANPAAARMLRLTPAELPGMALERFVPARARERHRELADEFGRAGSAARLMAGQREIVGLRADGEEFPIEATISRLDVDGRRLSTVILRDITDRRRAEAAARRGTDRLRRVLAMLPEAVLLHNGERVSFVNEAASELFGADESALLGVPVDELVQPESLPALRLHLAALPAGERTNPPFELTVRRIDGSGRNVLATAVRQEQDGDVAILVLMRDVTEVQRMQGELRQSEARFREVLMHLPEPLFIRTDGRIRFVNRAALDLFGSPQDEVVGRSPLDFCHPDSQGPVNAHLEASASGGARQRPVEATVRRGDGTSRMVEVMGAPIDFGGRVSLIVMLRDVSELRAAQRQLASSHSDLQRLVSALDRVQEEERKRIARELHDDLQQRLAAIMMNLSHAGGHLRRDPDNAGAALSAAIGLAASAIDSTRRIVNDLRPQLLDDLGLVAALEALCAQFGKTTGITCRVQAQGDALDPAMTAPRAATCLYRVAQESLNNVIKHTRASEVRIELSATAEHGLRLRVIDNGAGMGPEARRKLGSFGLLGMHERLRMLGGRLAIDSAPGAGTTIEATLPATLPATEPHAEPHAENPA